MLGTDILKQRAAHGDVDQLHAAADAEHRFVLFHEGERQFNFVVVADLVAAPLGLHRRFAITGRAHVGTALQHQAIEFARVVPEFDGAVLLWSGNHQQHRAARHDPARHGLLQILQRLTFEDVTVVVGVKEAGG